MDVKPGTKTTEFYLTAASTVILALYAFGIIGDGERDALLGIIAVFLNSGVYTVSRAYVKTRGV